MMNPLDGRYIGSACEIRTFANELVGVGVVAELGEDFIVLGAKEECLRVFNSFEKLKLNIFNSRAGFCVLICEVLTSTRDWLKVVDPVRIAHNERRENFRVPVALDAKIAPTKESLEKVGKYQYKSLQMIWIKDMSICGLRIQADRMFIMGQVIWLSLKLDEFGEIAVKAQIVRTVNDVPAKKGEKELKEYGVRLLFEREEDRDKLCSYIFKVQREEAKKLK